MDDDYHNPKARQDFIANVTRNHLCIFGERTTLEIQCNTFIANVPEGFSVFGYHPIAILVPFLQVQTWLLKWCNPSEWIRKTING